MDTLSIPNLLCGFTSVMAMSSYDQTSLKFQPPQQDRIQNTFRLFHPSSPHPRFPSPHPPLTVHRRHGALEADDISERSSYHTGLNDRSHDNVHVVDQPPGVAVPNLQICRTSERRNKQQPTGMAQRSTHNRYSQPIYSQRCSKPIH